MTIGGFILRNAVRNKRRALLSILSVAVSLFLLVTLLVGLRELTQPPSDQDSAARIVVRNKISLGNLLPRRQRTIIEKIPGVAAVTPFTWFGGKFRDEEVMFGQFAIEPKLLQTIFGEAKMPAEQFEAFVADPTSCIVGIKTAEKYGLKIGEFMKIQGTFWPIDLNLKLVGIYADGIDDRNLFFHHRQLDEMPNNTGEVGTWWVKAATLEDVGPAVQAINAAFANTTAAVRAETERAFQLSFISMWGNIKMLVFSICSVVVFTLVLVSASTMSMAVRERFRELAILKAIGFQRRELFAFILAESFGLAAAGAVLGVGGAWGLFNHTDMVASASQNFLVLFEVTPRIMAQACLVATLLGVVASIAPSLSVARMSVVQGLKTLD